MNLTSDIRWWRMDWWLVRYASILAGFGVIAAVFYTGEYVGSSLMSLQLITAKAVTWLLGLVGMEVVRQGVILIHPSGFSYQISHGCVGLMPLVFLALGMGLYPASWGRKVSGVLVGGVLLVGLNFVRLVQLFWLGVAHPEWFHFAHAFAWQVVTVSSVFGIWAVWTARRPSGKRSFEL